MLTLETTLYYTILVLAHLRVMVAVGYTRDYTTPTLTRARPPACDGRVHLLTRDNTIPLMRSHLRVVDGAAPAVLADVAAVGSVAVVLLEALGQGQG